jgi:A/G-specific adenine glycosylase
MVMQGTITIKPEMFREKLLAWWKNSRRMFPWRNTRDPYKILVSEVFLHRTKADQVVSVFNEFVQEFPTVRHLAKAKQSHVTKILRPLGLFWRNRLLIPVAKEIVSIHQGRVPAAKSDLESLPGVSNYIASAVSCFAFGKGEPLLDTNTVRILGRMFTLTVNDSSRRSNEFAKIYSSLMSLEQPRQFNYAMIDLGALVCLSRNPSCEICPVNDFCSYGLSRIGEKK